MTHDVTLPVAWLLENFADTLTIDMSHSLLIDILPPSSLSCPYPVACLFMINSVSSAASNDTSAIEVLCSLSAGWFWSLSCSSSDGGVGLKWARMEDKAELIALTSLGHFFLGFKKGVGWALLPGGHYICMYILLPSKKMDYSLWNSHFLCRLEVTLCSLTRIQDSSSSQTCVWALSEIFLIAMCDHFPIWRNFGLVKLSSAHTLSN